MTDTDTAQAPPEVIRYELRNGVAWLTINRPEALNALSTALLEELDSALADLSRDAEVGALVLTGAGERAFIAGADIAEMATKTPLEARSYAEMGHDVAHRLETMRKPTIAAVNGFALGGGCEMALACDLRLASSNARFGQPEITLGLIPGYAGTQRLPRLVGRGQAMEMILSGAPIAADEALRIGLVNRVVPAANLMTDARALAAQLARNAPIAADTWSRWATPATSRARPNVLSRMTSSDSWASQRLILSP